MFCSKCGKQAPDDASFCDRCGASLKGQQTVVMVSQEGGFSSLIPPNTPALWAYYLGIASMICFLTAVPAFIMGIIGVRHANLHPEAKGKIHAWVGIILGGLGTLFWGAVLFVISGGILYARHQ